MMMRENQISRSMFRHNLNRFLYEYLVRLWPVRKGKSRWMAFIYNIFRICPYGVFKTMIVGNYQLRLDPGDPNDRCYYFSIAGYGYSKLMSKILRKGDNVIDVGANVGHFSTVCAKLVGERGKVYALEANPILYERLHDMIYKYPQGPLQVFHAAVWKDAGAVPFHIATNSGWSSVVKNNTFQESRSVEVPSWTLDDFARMKAIHHIRILKLDIEGAETDALLGASAFLNQGITDAILFEAEHFRLKAYGKKFSEIVSLMNAHRYEAVCALQGDKIIPISDQAQFKEPFNGDYLYVRKSIASSFLKDIFNKIGYA